MICPKCQEPIGDDSVFCTKCGAAISANSRAGQQPEFNQANFTQQGQAPQQNTYTQQNPQQWQQPQQGGFGQQQDFNKPPQDGFNQPFQGGFNQQQGYNQQWGQQPNGTSSDMRLLYTFSFIPILFWMPLAFDKSNNPLGKHVANQSLLLLILTLACNILNAVVRSVLNVVFNWWTGGIFSTLFGLLFTAISIAIGVFAIIGMVKTYNQESYSIPVIGHVTLLK